jgi:hypothetical protein
MNPGNSSWLPWTPSERTICGFALKRPIHIGSGDQAKVRTATPEPIPLRSNGSGALDSRFDPFSWPELVSTRIKSGAGFARKRPSRDFAAVMAQTAAGFAVFGILSTYSIK